MSVKESASIFNIFYDRITVRKVEIRIKYFLVKKLSKGLTKNVQKDNESPDRRQTNTHNNLHTSKCNVVQQINVMNIRK